METVGGMDEASAPVTVDGVHAAGRPWGVLLEVPALCAAVVSGWGAAAEGTAPGRDTVLGAAAAAGGEGESLMASAVELVWCALSLCMVVCVPCVVRRGGAARRASRARQRLRARGRRGHRCHEREQASRRQCARGAGEQD